MYKSLNVLPVMNENIDLIGDPIPGAGYWGHTTGLHTCAITVQNFRGRVYVQASITDDPSSDDDWFTVLPGNVAYITYPRPSYIICPPATGESSIMGFNFQVNAIWVRAMVIRSYFIPALARPMFIGTFGLVDSILLNY